MRPQESLSGGVLKSNSKDFSLFVGGPLFQLLRRARLTDDALGMGASSRHQSVTYALVTYALLTRVPHTPAIIDQREFPFDLGCHIRQLPLNALEFTDGPAELLALLGVLDRRLEGALRHAQP